MAALPASDVVKYKEMDAEYRMLARLDIIVSTGFFLVFFGIVFVVTKARVQGQLIFYLPTTGVLFYSYVLTGILLLILEVTHARLAATERGEDLRHDILRTVATALSGTDAFAKLRVRLASSLGALAMALVWPSKCIARLIILRHFIDLTNPFAIVAAASLNRGDYIIAPAVSATLVLLWITAYPPWEQELYFRLFVILLLAHVTLRQASYVLSLQPLQDALRQSLGNPYIRFVTIAISDLISLTVAYTYLTSAYQFETISGTIDVMLSILSVQEMLDLLETRNAAATDYLMKLSSLLFYTTIFKSIWQSRQFKRNDADYAAIGVRYLVQNRFEEAERWFDRMRNAEKPIHQARAMAYFGEGRLEDAIDAFQRSLDVSHAKSAADIMFYRLIGSAGVIEVDENVVRSFIAMGPKREIRDSTMVCSLMSIYPIMKNVVYDVDLSASQGAYPLSLAFVTIMNIVKNIAALGDNADEAIVVRIRGEIEEVYGNLSREHPQGAIDQIYVAGLIIMVLNMSIHKPDADAIKHDYIGEIEVHTSKLSQDIDKEQAAAVLVWLADIIGDEPALKARVVECCFTTIKKIEASEVRNLLMRVVRVHLGESAAPAQ